MPISVLSLPRVRALSRFETDTLFRLRRADRVAALISIANPGAEEPWFVEAAAERIPVLRVEMTDRGRGERGAPREGEVAEIVDFLREVLPALGPEDVLLVHCKMGVSRSTAVAVLAWALLRPRADPETLAQLVLMDRPVARPNRWILELGAPMVGRREGELLEVADIIEGEP